MKIDIKYMVIYCLNILKENSYTLSYFKPECIRYPKWEVIENEVEYIEYFSQYRKYTAILNNKELLEFLLYTGYIIGTHEAMGILTTEYGLLPAISFETEIKEEDIFIAPLIENIIIKKANKLIERDFRDAMEINIMDSLKKANLDKGFPSHLNFNFQQQVLL